LIVIANVNRNHTITLTVLIFAWLALGSRASAASLADYRSRVSQAAEAMRQLETPDYYAEGFIEHTLVRVRDLLPATESVLLNGQSIEVDNAWLHDALKDYEKIRNDRERSARLVRRTADRLRALVQRLDELTGAPSATDKDTSKARLAEILRRPEYDKSAAQGSAIARLWDRFIRWLMKLFPRTKPLQPGTSRALSGVAQIIVIAISVALIAFLIWKFLPRYLRNRGQKKKTKREARVVLGERLEPDQTAADLLEQAEALARTGDLRGAIRKAYIALLCELGDRKIISLAQHKTNRDYLMSVRDKASLYQSMRKLTASFELHWYGFVPPAAADWAEFRLGCRNAVTK
jgi:hypothetical protein